MDPHLVTLQIPLFLPHSKTTTIAYATIVINIEKAIENNGLVNENTPKCSFQ